jgi:hypothetical protein
MLNEKGVCQTCFREFELNCADDGEHMLHAGEACPAIDDCPSHFEEKGIMHPDHRH